MPELLSQPAFSPKLLTVFRDGKEVITQSLRIQWDEKKAKLIIGIEDSIERELLNRAANNTSPFSPWTFKFLFSEEQPADLRRRLGFEGK